MLTFCAYRKGISQKKGNNPHSSVALASLLGGFGRCTTISDLLLSQVSKAPDCITIAVHGQLGHDGRAEGPSHTLCG